MRICLVGYVDNTQENREMLEAYELRNDFWAENIKIRRRDGKQMTDGELIRVSEWIDREIVKKHRTNWLRERNPEYIDVEDPSIIKRFFTWMSDEHIQEILAEEQRHKLFGNLREEMPYEEWERRMIAMPGRPNDMPANAAKQLELRFED